MLLELFTRLQGVYDAEVEILTQSDDLAILKFDYAGIWRRN
jgi:hypothetical protein